MNPIDTTLWFAQPANDWHAALPVGNGHLGAMVFGDPVSERIQVNEESIWAGPPVPESPATARAAIQEARQLIGARRFTEADKVILDKALGNRYPHRSQQPLGDVLIRFAYPPKPGEITGYRRELDLNTAVATSEWTRAGVGYQAEVFCSVAENVCIARYRVNTPGKLTCSIQFRREAGAVSQCIANDSLRLAGQASHAGLHLGVKFTGVLKAVTNGGEIRQDTDTLHVVDATELILYLAVATDYNFDSPANPRPGNPSGAEATAAKDYADVFQKHLADHQALFSRVSLELGEPSDQPIDARVKAYQSGATDTALEALQFQYGRYLLITSSRPGCLPANLQGVWNDKLAAPWNADYHLNINIQMNYWLAEVTNLSECHEPFFDLMEGILPAARQSAAVIGCRGAYAGHVTDVWLWATIFGLPRWGMWVMGLAWCAQHFMEHVRFTGDQDFLRQRTIPMLRECSLFFLDWLVPDPQTGKLVSGPSNSPENGFTTDRGPAVLTMGCSMDQEIIWDTFKNYLEALRLAGETGDIEADVTKALANLALPGIGSDGRLKEWTEEFKESEPGHRHVSHLFALHPGRQFTHEESPELVQACQKSLDYRLSHGGGQTGWSRTWLINFRARLRQGDLAHEDVRAFISKLTVANLFCTHPPFQIDGNFGYTSGVAEMLLQSHQVVDGKPLVHLVPALPKAWATGKVRGLRARGGFEIDMEWVAGKLVKATVLSHLGNPGMVRVGEETRALTLSRGERIEL